MGTPFVEAQKRGIDAEKCRGGEKSIRAEIPARLAVKAEDAFGADVGLVSLRARRVPCRDVVLGCLRSACGPLARAWTWASALVRPLVAVSCVILRDLRLPVHNRVRPDTRNSERRLRRNWRAHEGDVQTAGTKPI